MGDSAWAPSYGPAKFGISAGGPASNSHTELTAVASPSADASAAAKPWDPQSPLFWFAGISALTFGLMAFSTTARVGKGTLHLDVGKV
jgi:hypothetical protein